MNDTTDTILKNENKISVDSNTGVNNRKRKIDDAMNSNIERQQTKVVRLRRKNGVVVQDCDVYIGRRLNMGGWRLPQSEWANPFSIKSCGGSAAVAVEKYREYISKNKELLSKIHLLKGKTLGCWCKSEKKENPCHGDVLAELADKVTLDTKRS